MPRWLSLTLSFVLLMVVMSVTVSAWSDSQGFVYDRYLKITLSEQATEDAVYRIEINGSSINIYNVKDNLEISGGSGMFWTLVKQDGSDVRVFDQSGGELYFNITNWDSVNKKATILVRLVTGTKELNIAYGNSAADRSSFNNASNVFDFYWHYSSNDLSVFNVAKGSWEFSSDGVHSTDGLDDVAYLKTTQIFNPDVVLEVKHKSAGSGGGYVIGFGEQYDTSDKIGIYSGVRQGANEDHSVNVDGTLYNTVSYPFNTDWHITKVVWTADKIEAWIDDSYYTYADVSRTDYPVLLQSNNHEHVWKWLKVYKLADPVNFTSIMDYVEDGNGDGKTLTIYVSEKMTQKRVPFLILFDLPFIPQQRSELLLPKAPAGYEAYKFILSEPIPQDELYAVLYILDDSGITKHLLSYGANTEFGQFYLDNLTESDPMVVYVPGINREQFKILLISHPLWWEKIAWFLGFLPKLESWG